MIKRLDLEDYLNRLKSLFAREKDYIIEGDIRKNYEYIKKLSNKDFKAPPIVKNLDTEIMHLKKYGDLSHSQIFEFIYL